MKKEPYNTTHIQEIDLLKAVLMLLVVAFHLVWFEHLHPYAKQVVYTFHMPGFLIISGYLMKIARPLAQFLRTILWFAVPYLVMESGYIVMASVLPINEHIDQLTLSVFLDKLLLHPIGLYWYLQTLIVCGLTYYLVFRYVPLKMVSRFILLGLICFCYTYFLGILSLSATLYFLAGAVIRQSGLHFLNLFQSSAIAVVAFVLLAAFPQNLDQATVGGVFIVYFALSMILWGSQYIHGWFRQLLLLIGRNTMLLFLFSPIFTILCKQLVPYLQFDPTGLVFLLVSLIICTAGCLAIGWLMDICRITPWFLGKNQSISSSAS